MWVSKKSSAHWSPYPMEAVELEEIVQAFFPYNRTQVDVVEERRSTKECPHGGVVYEGQRVPGPKLRFKGRPHLLPSTFNKCLTAGFSFISLESCGSCVDRRMQKRSQGAISIPLSMLDITEKL